MAKDREAPTLADYAVTAVSPVLIMLMVGSLVFFLVEVLYAGKYSDKLLYSLFFFVIGTVLVARIAIQVDGSRAMFYGLALGLVTFLAMTKFVDYPADSPLQSFSWLVNLGLMAVVWWSAHKLTWDCTHIDENQDASGKGLLAAAGLDADVSRDPKSAEGSAAIAVPPAKKKKKRKKNESQLWNWIENYKKYREQERAKGHTPGVWVIYFSLAALPLFALGQSLVDPEDDARRWRTFVQMAVYVGSGLGLLVTTSLLGLRRYLRQRKVTIPGSLTASWLGLGGVLIVAFLVMGTFLPRPHSEVPWFGIQRAGKSDLEASKYAQTGGNSGKGEGNAGDQTEKGNGNASGKNGEPGGGKGEKGSGGKGEKGSGGGKDAKSSSGGKSGDGKKGSDSKGKDGNSSKDEEQRSGREGDADKDGDDAKSNSGDKSRSGSSSTPKTGAMAAIEKVAGILKWIVFAVIALLVIVGIVLGVLRYLSPFTSWARNLLDAIRNWWANLFGGAKSISRKAMEERPRGPVRPPPFHDYSNPFEDGTASGRDARELIAYTFEALDAWAWDRGHGREFMETPLEFASRLGLEFDDRDESIRRFVNLYVRSEYSETPLPGDAKQLLEAFWDELIHGAGVVAVG